MDTCKKKQSLPRLKTNVPLLEQSSNAACNALPLEALPDATTSPTILPEIPAKKPSLIKLGKPEEENVPPVARGPDTSSFRLPQGCPADVSPLTLTKRSFYDDKFSLRGSPNSPRDRVTFECVFVVELKTNIKVKEDTHYILSELVRRLAQLYDRPETQMLVTIDQNADLVFGTPSDSGAYLLKISAHSSMMTPRVNARITNNMQCTLEELLGITSDRGIVIFTPVMEENLGRNGTTAWAEIDRLERVSSMSPSVFQTLSRSVSRRIKLSSGTSAPMSLFSPRTDVTTSTPSSPSVFDPAETSSRHPYQPDDKRPTDRSESGRSPKGEQEQVPPTDVKPGQTLSKKASFKYIFSRLSGSGERKSKKEFNDSQKEN